MRPLSVSTCLVTLELPQSVHRYATFQCCDCNHELDDYRFLLTAHGFHLAIMALSQDTPQNEIAISSCGGRSDGKDLNMTSWHRNEFPQVEQREPPCHIVQARALITPINIHRKVMKVIRCRYSALADCTDMRLVLIGEAIVHSRIANDKAEGLCTAIAEIQYSSLS